MNYTRKRALLACDFCRHRKRRCDGERPCSTCRESNADCRYKDLPVERVEHPSAANEAVVERLGRIETLLMEQAQRINELMLRSPVGVATTTGIPPQLTGPGTAMGMSMGMGMGIGMSGLPMDATAARAIELVETGAAAAAAGGGTGTASAGGSSFLMPDPTTAAAAMLGVNNTSSVTSPSVATTRSPPMMMGGGGSGGGGGGGVHHLQPPSHRPSSIASSSSFLTAAATRSPVFGYSTATAGGGGGSGGGGGPQQQQPQTAGFVSTRPLVFGRAPSVSSSSVSSQLQTYGGGQGGCPMGQSSNMIHAAPVSTDRAHFLIPYAHSTSANALLSLPLVRSLLSTSTSNQQQQQQQPFYYPRSYFFEVERNHPLPPQLDLLHAPGLTHPTWPPSVLLAAQNSNNNTHKNNNSSNNTFTMLDGLAANYFAFVHPHAPLFDRATFRGWALRVYETLGMATTTTTSRPAETVETAVCLCVWALGALVGGNTGDSTQAERDQIALSLFQPALRILLYQAAWAFGPATLELCQGLLLAAAYFGYMARPLHNAQLVRIASQHFLRMFEERKRDGLDPDSDDKVLRVYWVCFMWECDRAAELDVPRSGVEPLADDMPLPSSFDPDESDAMIYFVAETAVRRLLNRIHNSFYAATTTQTTAATMANTTTTTNTDDDLIDVRSSASTSTSSGRTTPGFNKRKRADSERPSFLGPMAMPTISTSTSTSYYPVAKMLPVANELHRQLAAWYDAIPDHLRPPLGGAGGGAGSGRGSRMTTSKIPMAGDQPSLLRARVLRMRYFAAQHMIHRPFVLAAAANVLSDPSSSQSLNQPSSQSLFVDQCIACRDASLAYLDHAAPLLACRSPYLGAVSQTSMACLVVLLIVQKLQLDGGSLVAEDLSAIRNTLAVRLRLWAVPGSGFEALLRVVERLPI